MRFELACLCALALAANTASASNARFEQQKAHRRAAQGYLKASALGPATVPKDDTNAKARANVIADTAAGYIYGPSLTGEAAPFPNGTLGNARQQQDLDLYAPDRADIDKRVAADAAAIQKAIMANGGLKTMDDYVNVLYINQWNQSDPRAQAPGIMTNYTQDLLFSMERLSQNPFPLFLVKPGDKLLFNVPEAKKIAGASLADLQKSGRLFVVDHSNQARYEKTTLEPKRYGAACSAYFYIDAKTKDFLPLAIKTNAGKDLVYTPLDAPNDWMLAKMAFNVNDMFHAQMFHLVVTHDLSEAVHQAALHTLSANHPVMILLERFMIQAYSSRIIGEQLCFNPGGHWDQLFYVNNVGCRQFVTEQWPTRGRYEDAYLYTDLKTRGLIGAGNKSPFKSFPYLKDAGVIHQVFAKFFIAFVNSYYPTDADVAADHEVQNWAAECTAKANVQGFPQGMVTKKSLVDILTHFGFIVTAVHHALNGGDPVGSKATLPFHLNALFAPLPEAKGVKDLMPFLPPPTAAVHYIGFLATFNRPFYTTSDRTLTRAFADTAMMKRFNKQTNAAAVEFASSMEALSKDINARGFDAQGLSEGSPFVYRTLDPGYIPFFSSV